MKIVCDACQAKYSISDDKVQGKVFKIRCKKCSNIIVVRGNAGAAEPAPAPQQEKDTRVYDYGYEGGDHAPAGDESVWHVVINQDQVGPMTAVEVQQRFAGGEIDAETYIWREGFPDWLPLSQVDTFASLAASGGEAAVAPRGGGANAVASMFGPGGGEDGSTGRSDPGDLFAAASASAARNDDDGGDLFGSKPAAAQANQGNSKLRGERNENSVLFSLNNLAQLASDKPAPAPAHAPSPSSLGAATGAAGGEGSGLIDIRSMASAYLGGPGGGPAKPATAGVGSMDDLPVFGGGGFSEPAVIVPISARSNNNKLMYALIGSVGLLAVAAVVVVIVMIKGGGGGGDKTQVASAGDKTATDKDTDTKPADTKAADTKAADTKAADTKAADTKAADTKAADTKAADTKAADTKAADTNPKVAANDTPTEPKHPATVAHKPPVASNPTPTQPKGPKPPVAKDPPAAKDPPVAKDTGGGCDEVSCVLNNYEGACCAKFKKGGGKAPSGGTATPSAGKGDAPESLDRAMISDGVGKVKARVTSCGEKSSAKGTVKVSVKVGPDGHVTNVSVKTSLDPAIDNCVVGIMQKATFAKTQTGGSFSYPYNF